MKVTGDTVLFEYERNIFRRICITEMLLCSLLLMTLCDGCIVNDNTTKSPDTGTYTIAISDSALSTYPGGGGVCILEMTPSENFAGNVLYRVESFSGLNATVNRSTVSKENSITELIIYPDSTISPGVYSVNLFHTHGGETDTLSVPVTISDFIHPMQYSFARNTIFPEFVGWIQNNFEPLKTINNEGYFFYAISNMGIGGSGTWIAITKEWEVHFKWTASSWFLVRRNGRERTNILFC